MSSSLIVYGFLLLVLILLPFSLLLAVLLFVKHRRQLWQALAPVSHMIDKRGHQRSALRGVLTSLSTRFPRAAQFASRRLDPHHPWGLSWTLASIGILAGLWLFGGVLEDLITKDPMVLLDIRLHNLVALFRTPALTQIMLGLTELGSPVVLTLLCLAIALLSMAAKRPRLAATVLLALLLTGLLSVSLKALISHPRPLDAIITAHEASFPSGHMLGSAVVYGLLAALLLQSGIKRGLRALGVVALLLLIGGVGLSRLYLGVHWPSDLLGSLALAFVLLVSLLFFLHYRGRIAWLDTYSLPMPGLSGLRAAGVALVLVAMAAASVMADRTRLLTAQPAPLAQQVSLQSLQTMLPTGLLRWSENLIGRQLAPISLLLVGSQADVAAAFERAGWVRADPATPLRLLQEAITAIQNQPDPTGPATPAFYADKPQDLTFGKPHAGTPSISRRHHARLWKTAYCLLPGCRPLWAATASFEPGFGLGIEMSPEHLPRPRIDTAADDQTSVVVADLTAAGARQSGTVATSRVKPAAQATPTTGDPFTTHGKAVVLVLP
jgi:membrane-associated phospholipid phosphatase